MHLVEFDGSFAGWRQTARRLLHEGMAPHTLTWRTRDEAPGLFDAAPASAPDTAVSARVRIPRQLLDELEAAARFRVADRWSLLYRILWRVAKGDVAARLAGDIDGSELHKRLKAVRREAHHLHAFLRFRPCQSEAGGAEFVAWFEPAHDILASASLHFAERMGRHRWLIATPDGAVFWDGQQLQEHRPCPPAWRALAEQPVDEGQALWLAYYGSTFNPARLNRSVLESNLPVRFWRHLPEGLLIPQLMSQARAGAQRDGQASAVARQAGKRIRARVSENAGPDRPD